MFRSTDEKFAMPALAKTLKGEKVKPETIAEAGADGILPGYANRAHDRLR